ncbi:MAG TPA: GntR family transcriptional regulator [Candidatus Sulfotelmatobacter sp.]|nr:GntR family transcriptional regulator [Candidatus Sulfotelmatobacter sp.]
MPTKMDTVQKGLESPALPRADFPRFLLDQQSFVPYYEQIVAQVRTLITDKRLSEGDTFYSEGEVARMLGISKMPVRQAFQKLRSEGLLVISRGKRPMIGSGKLPWNFQQLRGFSEEMRRRGLEPSARVLSLKRKEPDGDVMQALNLQPGDEVYCLKRLRFVEGQPVAVVTSFLPAAIFPDIDKQNLEGQSLYHVFEQVYKRKLHWAEEVIGAAIANPEDARLLQASAGSAVLLIKEKTYDTQEVAIEYSVSVLRGDRYTASVVSVRKK